MNRRAARRSVTSYVLLLPSLIGVGAFLLLPILVVAWLSLHSWNLLGPREFVGLRNWRSVLGDAAFGHALLVTLALTVIVVPAQTVLGFTIAAPLARRRGARSLRVMYALPWMCAPVAVGVVWQWMFAPTGGVVNAVLGRRIEWLSDPALALPSVAAVSVWANFGYVALFFVAGIRAIPGEILDAGALDGAADPAAAASHHVLRPRHRRAERVPDLRHRLRVDQGRARRSHGCGRDAHLLRGVRRRTAGPGRRHGAGGLRGDVRDHRGAAPLLPESDHL
jgi:ABC-type sugar transport system permease subunit